jgi:hypothetical protein
MYACMNEDVHVYRIWIILFKELIHDFFVQHKQKSVI